jgi:hypothetical protein
MAIMAIGITSARRFYFRLYHWMETIVYKSIQYIPLALIGYGLADFSYYILSRSPSVTLTMQM